MANRNTKRTRVANGYKARTGMAVNSSELRAATGKARYKAPTITDRNGTAIHPVSGLTNREMSFIIS